MVNGDGGKEDLAFRERNRRSASRGVCGDVGVVVLSWSLRRGPLALRGGRGLLILAVICYAFAKRPVM